MLLAIENVYKSYPADQGPKEVLRGVSLELEAGRLQTLLGRSGSGKTTLLRLIAGYEPWMEGQVWFEAHPLQGPSPERFMVFQDYNQLYPWKTVRDNLLFALGAARPELTKAQRVEQADYWLAETELTACARQWPRQLSGGMKQRAALARAFALHPKLLLLDEPFAGLDAVLRSAMQALLRDLCGKHGVSALFVTHDLEEALALCPQPAVLTPDGRSIHRLDDAGNLKQQIIALLGDDGEGAKA